MVSVVWWLGFIFVVDRDLSWLVWLVGFWLMERGGYADAM